MPSIKRSVHQICIALAQPSVTSTLEYPQQIALDQLSKFFSQKPKLSQLQVAQLWKGVFYLLLQTDKVANQQRVIKDICDLVHNLDHDQFLSWSDGLWIILLREWAKLDILMLDKFLSLIRHTIRQAFHYFNHYQFDPQLVQPYVTSMANFLLNPSILAPEGPGLHVVSLWWSELFQVTGKDTSSDILFQLLFPYFIVLKNEHVNANILKAVFSDIFNVLISKDMLGQADTRPEDDTLTQEEIEQRASEMIFLNVPFAKITFELFRIASNLTGRVKKTRMNLANGFLYFCVKLGIWDQSSLNTLDGDEPKSSNDNKSESINNVEDEDEDEDGDETGTSKPSDDFSDDDENDIDQAHSKQTRIFAGKIIARLEKRKFQLQNPEKPHWITSRAAANKKLRQIARRKKHSLKPQSFKKRQRSARKKRARDIEWSEPHLEVIEPQISKLKTLTQKS